MPNINPVSLNTANPDQRKIMEAIKAKMGKVPNIYATIVHSPTTMQAMMSYHEDLKKGSLSGREIEAIALAVGQENDCDYCLAAHTVLGKMAGLSSEEMIAARKGDIADPKMAALVKFALDLVRSRGKPSRASIESMRAAGYGDGAIVDATAWVSYNIFTNYINHVADTQVDFPKAPPLE